MTIHCKKCVFCVFRLKLKKHLCSFLAQMPYTFYNCSDPTRTFAKPHDNSAFSLLRSYALFIFLMTFSLVNSSRSFSSSALLIL